MCSKCVYHTLSGVGQQHPSCPRVKKSLEGNKEPLRIIPTPTLHLNFSIGKLPRNSRSKYLQSEVIESEALCCATLLKQQHFYLMMSVYHQCGDCQLLEAGSYNKRKAHVGPRTVGGVASPCNAWGAKRQCQYSHPVVMCTFSKQNILDREALW